MQGIINVLKPPGMSSGQVVGAIRRLTGVKRVGHSGTLDPPAAGVLPIFIGTATRLVEYAMAGVKTYIGEICFGTSTDTQDAQGCIVAQSGQTVDEQTFRSLFFALPDVLWQKPPAYSAIKQNGVKMVDLARKGLTPDIPRRKVALLHKAYLGQSGPNRFLFEVGCSKGTYIRTLCHDLGVQSGAYAHLAFLLRTRTGPFVIDQAVTLEEIAQAQRQGRWEDVLLPMQTALAGLPRCELLPQARVDAFHGKPIAQSLIVHCNAQPGQSCAMFVQDTLIGVALRLEDGLQLQKVLIAEG